MTVKRSEQPHRRSAKRAEEALDVAARGQPGRRAGRDAPGGAAADELTAAGRVAVVLEVEPVDEAEIAARVSAVDHRWTGLSWLRAAVAALRMRCLLDMKPVWLVSIMSGLLDEVKRSWTASRAPAKSALTS